MKTGDIINIIILGGIGYVAYKFLKGDWKLPKIPSIPDIPREAGKTIYNITYEGGLKDKLKPGSAERQKSKTELWDYGVKNPTDYQERARTIARETAEDVIKGPFGTGMAGALGIPVLGWGTTIGAGLGAITAQQKLYDTLTPQQLKKARTQEYNTRADWMYKHPVESTIGLPAQVIHEVTKPTGAKSSPVGEVAKFASGVTTLGAIVSGKKKYEKKEKRIPGPKHPKQSGPITKEFVGTLKTTKKQNPLFAKQIGLI